MQRKTIEKTIKNKLNEWLETIENKKLRESVRKNILVSGGSIASMFLNTDINDYDIYLQNMDVLKELTHYYVGERKGITVLDGRDRDQIVNDVEGGFQIIVENLHDDQIKLYFDGYKPGLLVDEEERKDKKYTPVYFSPNAISLSDQIQIVIRFNGDNEKIHSTFDFIHATNYFTFEDGLVTNIAALESLLSKQLRYQGSLYPLTSIIRMKKFIKRGWNISAGEMLKIMFQISQLDLTDPNTLEEQLIGVDVAYFSLLIEIIRGVESKKITSAYINSIIDKVFNESDEIEQASEDNSLF